MAFHKTQNNGAETNKYPPAVCTRFKFRGSKSLTDIDIDIDVSKFMQRVGLKIIRLFALWTFNLVVGLDITLEH